MKCYYEFHVESLLIIKKTPFYFNNSVYIAVQYEQLVEKQFKSIQFDPLIRGKIILN